MTKHNDAGFDSLVLDIQALGGHAKGINGGHRRAADGRREAPLAILGAGVLPRFHAWFGWSGTRYVASIFPVDHQRPASGLPDLGPAVLFAVRRRDDGRRVMTGLQAIERDSDWARAATRLHADAGEWHVHLLAGDRAARSAVVGDFDAERLAVVA